MTMRLLAALLPLAIVVVITDAAAQVAPYTAGDLKAAATMELCRNYLRYMKPADMRAELESRTQEIPASDWPDIDATRLRIGMREVSMVCALGYFHDVNTSVGSWGTRKQYVFNCCYVYVENGKVTSWQY